MLQFDAERLGIELHDWTAYQIAACFGRVHFDEAGHMSYRQHGDNQIGARSERFFSRIGKIPAFWNGPMKNSRSDEPGEQGMDRDACTLSDGPGEEKETAGDRFSDIPDGSGAFPVIDPAQ